MKRVIGRRAGEPLGSSRDVDRTLSYVRGDCCVIERRGSESSPEVEVDHTGETSRSQVAAFEERVESRGLTFQRFIESMCLITRLSISTSSA